MFSKIFSLCLQGIEGTVISVEADVSDGLPGYVLVGYLASEVKEAQDRVRTALKNLQLHLPPKKVTINLSPADLRKEGTAFDLAIAVAVLCANGALPANAGKDAAFIGELGLDGMVKGIPGVLGLTDTARKSGFRRLFLPRENLNEAGIIRGIGLVGVENLQELTSYLRGDRPAEEYERREQEKKENINKYEVDFSEIHGQQLLRRAAEIAVAGKHNLLMIGPAGSGKTMVARRLPTIMPPMSMEESIEISKIYSACHLLSEEQPLILVRPFRAPHHTVSSQALSGGGSRPRPGEISLATGGILFLDELPEMSRACIESLRQPLEEHQITISRVQGSCCYPANFQLVAAMNPCLCGYYPDRLRCTCTEAQIRKYLGKISGPLLDRMDICVEASPVSYAEISANGKNETSAQIRERVMEARRIQADRFAKEPISCNGEMGGGQVQEFCILDRDEKLFMEKIFTGMQLSARMYDKILKVARTAADLDRCEKIGHRHLCEAVSYAQLKEKYWRR